MSDEDRSSNKLDVDALSDLPDELAEQWIQDENDHPTHDRRAADPPTVPPHGDRALVWLEWMVLPESVAHFSYHRAEPGSNDTKTVGPAILTREERAQDLGSTPCPHCFPDHPDNDHLATMYDEETGVATTINPEAFEEMDDE